MARSFNFECDGCDWERTTEDCELPSHWADIAIRIDGYTNSRFGETACSYTAGVLCPDCQIRLRDISDPKKWARAAKDAA